MSSADDFRRTLNLRLRIASRTGVSHVDINAGHIHREVGEYPGRDHRMPICCAVMRSEMTSLDPIIAAPPKGNGASLTIRYRLPRG